jgi:5'-nucleotidase/UDP-sugar diphosphatase
LDEASAIKPWIIKEISNGERVGICGITTKTATELSSFPDEGTTVDEEQASAEACVQELEAEGVNKIVLLTHVGYSNDLMTNIEGVDVIIGGHSHSLLGSTDFNQFGFPTKGDYAQIVNGKCVITAWEYARAVGELTVSFDEAGAVIGCEGATKLALNAETYTVRDASPRFDLSAEDAIIMTDFLLSLETTPFIVVEPDAETTAVLAPFILEADAVRLDVIAQAPEAICHTYTEQDPVCPTKVTENWLGGGVCNLVSKGFLLNVPTADVAIQNRGGCRTDILKGDVSYGAVFDILPFSNTLSTLEMTGEAIRLTLEDALNFFLDPVSLPSGPLLRRRPLAALTLRAFLIVRVFCRKLPVEEDRTLSRQAFGMISTTRPCLAAVSATLRSILVLKGNGRRLTSYRLILL